MLCQNNADLKLWSSFRPAGRANLQKSSVRVSRRQAGFLSLTACADECKSLEISVEQEEFKPDEEATEIHQMPEKPKRIPWNKGLRFIPGECKMRSPEERVKVEKDRRKRISDANKGRLPWNAGRKHSPETIQRIKERTTLAMKDPKVREKLRGFQQSLSPEVKTRISMGVHEYWMKKLKKLAVQNQCLIEWQECIAETARKGGEDEEELRWDSYAVLLQQEKDEFIRLKEELKIKRKKTGRKLEWSEEHRRKVSDAIRAKWATEEYRSKVLNGIKTRSRESVVPRRPRPPRPVNPSPNPRPAVSTTTARISTTGVRINEKFVSAVMADEEPYVAKQKPVKVNGVAHPKLQISQITATTATTTTTTTTTTATERLKKVAATPPPPSPPLPTFVDSQASEKTEKLRQLRASRLLVEMRKKEAADRAKMLMAEAEKAAKALEAVAFKDQFAMASLLETRKLLAEAARSIKAMEGGGKISELSATGGGPEQKSDEEEEMKTPEDDSKKLINEAARRTTDTIAEVSAFPTSKRKKRWHNGRLTNVDD